MGEEEKLNNFNRVHSILLLTIILPNNIQKCFVDLAMLYWF